MASPEATSCNFNVSRVNTTISEFIAEVDSKTTMTQEQQYALREFPGGKYVFLVVLVDSCLPTEQSTVFCFVLLKDSVCQVRVVKQNGRSRGHHGLQASAAHPPDKERVDGVISD